MNEINEKMPFKIGVNFAVPVYMGRKDILYEVRSKSAKTVLQIDVRQRLRDNINIKNGYELCRGFFQYGYVL